eukprot:Lithocolla_globosa_v1_NODE_4742_length_1377_cov_3.543116.p2 type:complete len:127 gc:universal NODE_4742_length_1377_cov_3.543116:775-1155(+)
MHSLFEIKPEFLPHDQAQPRGCFMLPYNQRNDGFFLLTSIFPFQSTIIRLLVFSTDTHTNHIRAFNCISHRTQGTAGHFVHIQPHFETTAPKRSCNLMHKSLLSPAVGQHNLNSLDFFSCTRFFHF